MRLVPDAEYPVVVVGGGQAGLSISWHLTQRNIDHVVLERNRVGHEWRTRRWDSFCLVTPNWQCDLPGHPYAGNDPDGFMVKDQILDYLDAYTKSFDVPLFEGVSATRLRGRPDGRYELRTTEGTLIADQVVVATGPYQVPVTPRIAERLPEGVTQLHSSGYRNADQLPDGDVLVVGSGQSGAQIAEDLHLAGRTVHLAVGSAPRVARFYRGRDVVAWLEDMGYYRRTIDDFADADAVRFRVNHYVTGRDGGRDIDLRAFARDGMRLHGRLRAIDESLHFDDDLATNLDGADRVSESIKDSIDEYLSANGIEAPEEPRYTPVWTPADASYDLRELPVTDLKAVIWSTGFGPDHRWIEAPVFNGKGYPVHARGVTPSRGLYFLGLPWQWTWGSGRFGGVGADAEHLAEQIAKARAPESGIHWLAGTPTETYSTDWVPARSA
ncbi:MSMEG_0569 family flavin-dependent oxidoreductase [Cryptosporangium phraense]|uniref:MSMEG_0569 family flavin-dependent oxidoreductase n=1 Tax=Cryptosporangium phraense TaxID=2593070 RepID=A0A545ALC8_9ACTN|nr:MSMEG_0569 family flavin-dependent oxidoreductase [Cryptosporangium phraense]TQS41535.1 MSMEG_0569 family flavin-dependent oxidoreductase [Cryptosporangium phraense]